MVQPADEVRVETYDGPTATLTDDLRALYAAVYAEPPYRDGPAEVAEFVAEWRELLNQPGFRLVVARTAGQLVGFALGHVVESASGWWAGIRPGPPGGDTADPVDSDSGHSFGIAELGVHPGWRRRRLASRLHEALLAGRSEPRVVLWVRADAPAARATYARWGYRLIGSVPDRPPYQVMCLDRGPTTRPADPVSYLLCGTPRTGSTLLGSLLASTGVAGRPESYFREPDEHAWARRLGVAVAGDGSFDYRSFVQAVRRAGSTPNGVFAARVMWGTMHRIVDGLGRAAGRRDLDVLGEAFGALRLVHLRRGDVVGQAVSWARAEQTGYWQDGDRSSAPPRYDPGLIEDLVRTIGEHDAAWSSWFAAQGVNPLPVTYEDVVGNPRQPVQAILDHLDVEVPPGWRPVPRQCRQADAVNADWVRRYRAALRPG